MVKLLLVLGCALLYANAAPSFFDRDDDGKSDVSRFIEYPVKVAKLHAAMPGEFLANPLGFAGKFAKQIVTTPVRLVHKVQDKISQKFDRELDEALDQVSEAVKSEIEYNSEEKDIVAEFNELEKLSKEMERRAGVMEKTINNYYDSQKSSLLLTKKEKEAVIEKQKEFNQFHKEFMAQMKDCEDMAEMMELRAKYLDETLHLFNDIQSKKCAEEYTPEEAEIVKQFSTPEVLTVEMERRAGVMINALNKYYNAIKDSSSTSEDEKREAAEKQAATIAYHEDMLKKMAGSGDMKTTMCYRSDYLVELLALYNSTLAQ